MDEKHISSVLSGDTNSFRHLVNKYKDLAYSVSISIVKSELKAQEAVQDSFVKAYQKLETFKNTSKFSTWLYRIVVNESLRKIKKKKLEIESMDSVQEDFVNNEPDEFRKLNEIDQQEIIADVLKQMNTTESLLLKLYYLEENKIEQVAEITGLSESNIKVILYRGRKNFYSILQMKYKSEIKSIL